jgi:hypothetical protein
MKGLMQATKIVNGERWRGWARLLAQFRRAGGRSRNSVVTRRKNPLQMAFARRERMSAWIDYHTHVAFRQFRGGDSIDIHQITRFSWTTDSALQRIFQRAGIAPVLANRAEGAGSPNIEHSPALSHQTIHMTLRAAKSTFREIVEGKRRIEERAAVATRLALRGKAAELEALARMPARQISKALSDDWWRPEPESTRHRSAAPAVNVEQIAETVLRQLDQRVTSWRERMGRR